MSLTVVWSRTASGKLRRLAQRIAIDNQGAALALSSRLLEATNRLAELPYLGRPGRRWGTRELVVHPNYLVIYRVEPGRICVVSVRHARQNYRRGP